MLSLLSGVYAAVQERSRVEILYSGYFRRCGTRSAASQVIPPHSAKSHYLFDALGGIDSQNAFPSAVIHINPGVKNHQKPPQASVKTFSQIKGFLFEILRFSCNTSNAL